MRNSIKKLIVPCLFLSLFALPNNTLYGLGGCNGSAYSDDVAGALGDFCRNCGPGDGVSIFDIDTGVYDDYDYEETCNAT